jgi:hypothetical protein
VQEHYETFVFPHIVSPSRGLNISLEADFLRGGGERTELLRELTFLTLRSFGGAKPELHGAKDGEFGINFKVGAQALKILLQRQCSALGPLLKAAIGRARLELRRSPHFLERCRMLAINPDRASINVVHAKVNIYLRNGPDQDAPPKSGSGLHRDKCRFWARILASLVLEGEAGGAVAELFFALIGYDGTSRLYGRRTLPRQDLDLLIFLSGCQRYGEACALHGVKQNMEAGTHRKSLANAVVDLDITLDATKSDDYIAYADVRSQVRSSTQEACPSRPSLCG